MVPKASRTQVPCCVSGVSGDSGVLDLDVIEYKTIFESCTHCRNFVITGTMQKILTKGGNAPCQ